MSDHSLAISAEKHLQGLTCYGVIDSIIYKMTIQPNVPKSVDKGPTGRV